MMTAVRSEPRLDFAGLRRDLAASLSRSLIPHVRQGSFRPVADG